MKKAVNVKKISERKQSKKELEKQNEVVTNRLMITFVLALILITFFIYVMNLSFVSYLVFYKINFFAMFITGALFLAAAVYFFICRKNNKDESLKTLSSPFLLSFAAVFMLYSIFINFKGVESIPVLLAVTITLTLLSFILFVYQKEFFLFSLITAVCCFLIYYSSTTLLSGFMSYIIKGLLIISGILICAMIFITNKNNGYINKKVRVFKEDSKIIPFILLALILIGVGILSFVTSSFIMFSIIGVIAYFLIIGIYYTIKLI